MRSLSMVAGLILLLRAGGVPAWSQPRPPAPGLEVHFTHRDNPGDELVFPCCEGIEPPPGIYRVWLEGAWTMTPFSLVVGTGATPVGPSSLMSLPIAEAGRVALPPDLAAGSNLELHLLHAGSYLEGGYPRWEIFRRRAVPEVGEGVLLPAGKALGALWDPRKKRYVALSRPFDVRGRGTVQVPLRRPAGVAHLFVQVRRQTVARTGADLDMELKLKLGRDERPPDFKVLIADQVYAVWYGLPPGPAELRGRWQQTFAGPELLDLAAGRIEHRSLELEPRPSLQVELELPALLRQEELLLVVRRSATGEIVAEQTLPPDALGHLFEGLPATRLEVDLVFDPKLGLGSFTRPVYLGAGRDQSLLLDPQLITLHGTVERGGEGRPAELVFTTVTRTQREARTNADGTYEVLLVEPVRTVTVLLEGEIHPYAEIFTPEIAESRELDIRLPEVDLRARVVDAVTGEGISGALINLLSKEEDAEVIYDVAVDEAGNARLPLLRPGTVELRAEAEGYSQRQAVQAKIDGKQDQSFEIRLEPYGETVELRLLLPNGKPAADAELLLMDSLEGDPLPTVLRADEEGVAEVPGHAGILLIRHRDAGFLVRLWRPRPGEVEMKWALPASADLTVQVKDASGGNAAPKAGLTLWVDGLRLSGPALAWLTGTDFRTDGQGVWIGRNLPQGPVEVLAWERSAGERARTGKLDAQATGVPFPWTEPVEVRVVE